MGAVNRGNYHLSYGENKYYVHTCGFRGRATTWKGKGEDNRRLN